MIADTAEDWQKETERLKAQIHQMDRTLDHQREAQRKALLCLLSESKRLDEYAAKLQGAWATYNIVPGMPRPPLSYLARRIIALNTANDTEGAPYDRINKQPRTSRSKAAQREEQSK